MSGGVVKKTLRFTTAIGLSVSAAFFAITKSMTMEKQLFTVSEELDISPSAGSSKNDFDFFIGKWDVYNRKLKTRLNNCTEWIEFPASAEMTKMLNGLGNIDFFHAGSGENRFEGMTLRLFNPETKLWSIYWADSNRAVLDTAVVGSFEKGIGHFYCRDVFEGKKILMQFLWDASLPNQPMWSQAFSDDEGKTWEWNWYMYFSR